MALESTQPLTEMSTRNLPGRKVQPTRKADNLTAICEPTAYKMWEPRRLTTLWATTACYRDIFTFFFFFLLCYERNILSQIHDFHACLDRENISHLLVQWHPCPIWPNYLAPVLSETAL
jgi:hypothetical protein